MRISGYQTTVQNGQAALTLHFGEPRLWSPDDPYLYEGLLLLTQDGETDEIGTYFGIREITVGKVDGRDFRGSCSTASPFI